MKRARFLRNDAFIDAYWETLTRQWIGTSWDITGTGNDLSVTNAQFDTEEQISVK